MDWSVVNNFTLGWSTDLISVKEHNESVPVLLLQTSNNLVVMLM